jgi:hypothetical protein
VACPRQRARHLGLRHRRMAAQVGDVDYLPRVPTTAPKRR